MMYLKQTVDNGIIRYLAAEKGYDPSDFPSISASVQA
jgi:hypothetical protein